MESKPSLESSKNKDKEQGNKDKSLYRLGAIVAGAATGIGLLAWGLSALSSSAGSESEEKKKPMKAPGSQSEEKKKPMKAPGKDEIIEREEFERDPKGYFRALRDK
ncbi:hypothetical protein ACFX13_030508 [Malus domestica]|uniref:Uncharacterized protein n=1 Tax=Malus domestica TaxID=3750 RepID=A0A498KBG9_MALDO|nr:uncharacterized protein LOC103423924 [Malus domestica]RXI04706.1 hypothetical protein DVH24_038980 [Malus domestica]